MSRFCANRLGLILWVVLVALTCPTAQGAESAAPETVRLGGAVNKPADWSVAKLKEAFAGQLKQVDYTAKGQKHVSTCVPLLAIVQAAEPATDPKHKNYAMRLAVVVRAGDGYAVTFGLGDLMPDVGHQEVWIAIDMDGKPLTGRDAPAKLIVPGDAKPTRAVWGVTRIDVVDPTAAGQGGGRE